MTTTSLAARVLSRCREDLSFTPDWPLLNEVGLSLKNLPMGDPLRTWWAHQRMEDLRGPNSRPEFIEAANAEFLRANGVELTDEISLDF